MARNLELQGSPKWLLKQQTRSIGTKKMIIYWSSPIIQGLLLMLNIQRLSVMEEIEETKQLEMKPTKANDLFIL